MTHFNKLKKIIAISFATLLITNLFIYSLFVCLGFQPNPWSNGAIIFYGFLNLVALLGIMAAVYEYYYDRSR